MCSPRFPNGRSRLQHEPEPRKLRRLSAAAVRRWRIVSHACAYSPSGEPIGRTSRDACKGCEAVGGDGASITRDGRRTQAAPERFLRPRIPSLPYSSSIATARPAYARRFPHAATVHDAETSRATRSATRQGYLRASCRQSSTATRSGLRVCSIHDPYESPRIAIGCL